MTTPTPPTPLPGTLIRSQADLHAMWEGLMQPLGFSARSLWFCLLDPDRRVLPTLTEITEMADQPDGEGPAAFARLVRHLVPDDATSCAMLLARPGRRRLRVSDRRWAGALLAACAAEGVPVWPVHLATDEAVVVVPPDALLEARIA